MSEGEWDTTPWHIQRAYLEGLEAEGIFEYKEGGGETPEQFGIEGMGHRTVEMPEGAVIDITGMLADLEKERAERRR